MHIHTPTPTHTHTHTHTYPHTHDTYIPYTYYYNYPPTGLYLTDLSYLHGIPNKGYQVECILNLIAYCQNSSYGRYYNKDIGEGGRIILFHSLCCLDSYVIEPHVKKYLTRLLYIDELQTFFEDENYK